MKYLKLFEEKKKYNRHLYYKSDIDDIFDKIWYNFRIRWVDPYEIKFETDDSYYSVYFDSNGRDDYYLEESAKPVFIEKFKKEFFKHPEEYVRNFKRDPKCLGNIEVYRETEKYNL